jgi:hypothetical protein
MVRYIQRSHYYHKIKLLTVITIYGTATVYHITNCPYCNYNKNKYCLYITGFPLKTRLQLRHKYLKTNKVGSLDILLVTVTTQLQ